MCTVLLAGCGKDKDNSDISDKLKEKAAAASDMLRRILDIDSLLCYFIVLTTVEADMPPQETV